MARQNFYALGTSIGGIADELESGVRTGLALADAKNTRDRQRKSDADAEEQKTYTRGREAKADTRADKERDRKLGLEQAKLSLDALNIEKEELDTISAGLTEAPEHRQTAADVATRRQENTRKRLGVLKSVGGNVDITTAYDARRKKSQDYLKSLPSDKAQARAKIKADIQSGAMTAGDLPGLIGYGTGLDPDGFASDGKTPSPYAQIHRQGQEALANGDLQSAGLFASQFLRPDLEEGGSIGKLAADGESIIISNEGAGFVPGPKGGLTPVVKAGTYNEKNGVGSYEAIANEGRDTGAGAPMEVDPDVPLKRAQDVFDLDDLINGDPELQQLHAQAIKNGAGKNWRNDRELFLAAGVKVPTAKEFAKEEREAKKGDAEIKNLEARTADIADAAKDRRTRSNKVAAGRGGAGGNSAKIAYVEFVAKAKFKGDQAKALDWIQSGNTTQIASSIANNLYDKQQKDRRTKGQRSWDDFYNDALAGISKVKKDDADEPEAAPSSLNDDEREELEALRGAQN